MSKQVIVVTNPELGWDCVVGVFSSKDALLTSYFNEDLQSGDAEEIISDMRDNGYLLHQHGLDT